MDRSLFEYNDYSCIEAIENLKEFPRKSNIFIMLRHTSCFEHMKIYGVLIENSNINSTK
jgi:hypothetical protein